MAVPEVNKKLLDELETIGFPPPRATRALHFSGNSSVENAINWILDHESDPDIDQMPLVAVNIEIEASKPAFMTEKVKLKALELRGSARRRKDVEEKKSESERERERIKAGKELMEAKQILEENERKRSLALREVEKDEEKRARERIRQKLQEDKAERRWRLGLPPDDPALLVKPATHMMQTQEEMVPVKAVALPVKFATSAKLIGECLRSLRRNHKDDDANVKKAFQTLLVYVRNVLKDRNEEKFRKIRFSNPIFQDRVGRFPEGIEFLELCGFERVGGGEFLYLPKDKVDIEVIKSAETQLHSAITNPYFGLISNR